MNSIAIGEEQMKDRLKMYVDSCKNQSEAARRLGIGDAFLSEMIRGKRIISERVARQLGYSRSYAYTRIGNPNCE
jgi:plasmid maintenance system antidote protein VapI